MQAIAEIAKATEWQNGAPDRRLSVFVLFDTLPHVA